MAKDNQSSVRDAGRLVKLAKVDPTCKEYFKGYFKDTDYGDELVKEIESRTAERLVTDAHSKLASLNLARVASAPSPADVSVQPFAVTKLANGNVAMEGAAKVISPSPQGPVTSCFLVQASFNAKGETQTWKTVPLGTPSLNRGAK